MKRPIIFYAFLGTLLLVCSSHLQAQLWKITEVEMMGTGVNTEAEESTPFFSNDGMILYFTRTFDPNNVGGEWDQDIWFSIRGQENEYKIAENLKKLNNKFNNAVVGLSTDGNRIYLLDAYGGKKDQVKGLAVSEKDNKGNWQQPKRVEIPELQIEGDFFGFYVAPEEDVIIISYNGPESIGDEDLYVTEYQNGTWTSPMHLGNSINSSGYEIAPFLNKTKDTLYFSSNGFEGFGEADIFYSVREGNDWKSWSAPVNMGEPINSDKFDAYINISNNIIYWSSNRNAKRSNIYRGKAEFYRFVGTVADKKTLAPIADVHLIIKDIKNDTVIIEELYTTNLGEIHGKKLPFVYGDSIHVKVIVDKEGYITKSLKLHEQVGDVTEIDLSTLLDINLTKIETGKTDLSEIIDISPIYFEYNSSEILKEAATELDKVVELMLENPRIVVELRAHTDSRGTETYNLRLSDRRAKSSAKYIISQGVDESRITGIGFEQSKPIHSDAAIKNASSSRERERMHQENRRTEFIITKIN